MKSWTVIAGSRVLGNIEALEPGCEDAARLAFDLGPNANFRLERDSRNMYILIDITNNVAIARHDSRKALAALALIQFANVDTVIIAGNQSKAFSIFDSNQQVGIMDSLGMTLDPETSYPEKIKALRAALENADHLTLPYTTAQLEDQAYCLAGSDDRPYAFDPQGNAPKRLASWHFEPQRNRKRSDSTFWCMFSAGLGYPPGKAPAQAQPTARASASAGSSRKAPPKPSAARTSAPAKPATPKRPKAPGARPKAGTATGKIWDLADALWDPNPEQDLKAFRAALVAAGEKEGINPGTIGVQFSKWKASKGL